VGGVNLVGDDQADRRVHGGLDKAVYVYLPADRRGAPLEPLRDGPHRVARQDAVSDQVSAMMFTQVRCPGRQILHPGNPTILIHLFHSSPVEVVV